MIFINADETIVDLIIIILHNNHFCTFFFLIDVQVIAPLSRNKKKKNAAFPIQGFHKKIKEEKCKSVAL